MTPFWKGPEVDGVTQSILNFWLQDPFAAYLYLILGLTDDAEFHPNLVWGDCFHVGLEHLIKEREYGKTFPPMLEHLATKYPHAPPTFKYSLQKMMRVYSFQNHMKPLGWETEVKIDEEIILDGLKFRIRGKKDAQNWDHPEYGRLLGEHKCKGWIDPEQTKDEIGQDLQCNLYMLFNNCEWVAYDLIKIPDTQKYLPAMNYSESPEEYVERLYTGPTTYGKTFPIYRFKHAWVHQAVYHIPFESQELYRDQTIKPLLLGIRQWYDHVTSDSFSLDSPSCYNSLFYRTPVRHFNARKTDSFKCPYHTYLTGQCDLSDLSPIDSLFSELE